MGEFTAFCRMSGPVTNVRGWPLKTATVPSATRRSTATGTIGAFMTVVWPNSGGPPTMVYGQTDCGLPVESKPGAVKESDQLARLSTPAIPVVAAVVLMPVFLVVPNRVRALLAAK